MTDVISNTSPLLYLYRIGGIDWLPCLFNEIWKPSVVKNELLAGRIKGYDDIMPIYWGRSILPRWMP